MKIVKKKYYGAEARKDMLEGIVQAADIVGSTMGAKGRNVIVDKEYGSPLIINDGVTIVNELFFKDPVKNVGVQLLKDAAVRTNALAGDGTTATTVLGRAIVKAGWDKVEKGANPVLLRKELDAAAEKIVKNLEEQVSPVDSEEKAIQIAMVSVQDKAIGEKLGKLMYEVGPLGAVDIKESIATGVHIENIGGMRIEGALTGGVVEDGDRWETKFKKPHVLILQDSPEDHEFELKWIPFAQQLVEAQRDQNGALMKDEKGSTRIKRVVVPELLIVAEKLSRRIAMFLNENRGVIKWAWFRPTTADKNMKEIYKDIAAVVGGDVVNEEEGVNLINFKVDQLGRANETTTGRHELIMSVEENKTDRYLDRVNIVKKQIDNAEDEIEQKQIKERYGALTGGVAVVRVLAATKQDTVELKLRIEDAINATRAAMEEGYVAGGGVALFNAAKDNKTNGEKILIEASKAPLAQILYNAGYENIDKKISLLDPGKGYNVITDKVVDMKKDGIVDPLKVVKLSLLNAVSVAGLLITSEYVVIEEPNDDVTVLRDIFSRK